MDANEALHELMNLYGQDVWNLAFSLTRRAEAADDIAQDVFIKAYQKWGSYRGEAAVKTWLLKIARNTALDYQRSAFWRKVTLVDNLFDRGAHPSAEEEALERLVQDEAWQQVLRLPIKYREVLVLHAHHGLTVAEIAELLDVLEPTVKSRLRRARSKVMEAWKGREAHGNESF
ncbi:MAG: sigma-70 family RNA polymerase sigma factor [Tumebacillaceae bacterium]